MEICWNGEQRKEVNLNRPSPKVLRIPAWYASRCNISFNGNNSLNNLLGFGVTTYALHNEDTKYAEVRKEQILLNILHISEATQRLYMFLKPRQVCSFPLNKYSFRLSIMFSSHPPVWAPLHGEILVQVLRGRERLRLTYDRFLKTDDKYLKI
jgi:hypothetical protein